MKQSWNDWTALILLMQRLNQIPNLSQNEEETETMSNPIFDAMGGNIPGNNILAQFQQFRKQMQGKNPHEEINKLLQSGAISQQELNQAQQMAQQFQSILRQ